MERGNRSGVLSFKGELVCSSLWLFSECETFRGDTLRRPWLIYFNYIIEIGFFFSLGRDGVLHRSAEFGFSCVLSFLIAVLFEFYPLDDTSLWFSLFNKLFMRLILLFFFLINLEALSP